MTSDTRLATQIAFLTQADKLKSVLRASGLCDASRRENSGEHSWHIALYAMVLAEYAEKPIKLERVIKMLLIHDLVEIDAGDQPIHGDFDHAKHEAAEQRAADRIFGLLPSDQREEFRALWNEFEAAETNDAVFAKSIDRLQPTIQIMESDGDVWKQYDVTAEQIERRVGVKVQRGAPALWDYAKIRINRWFAKQ